MSLIPARGEWRYRLFDSKSTATFVKGSAVCLAPDRTVIEYTSVKSQWLGIAMHNSVDSLANPGKVLVAVPTGLECTFRAKVATGTSVISIGESLQLAKSGNTVNIVETAAHATSQFSRVALAYSMIESRDSTIECAVTALTPVFFSASTITVAT
jgi:hypothetical protein